MKKCCFIIPYFGKFNNYFQLFLNSCSYNVDYDWLIFTDDQTKYVYPNNVKVIYESFEDMKKRIQSKFDFKIALNTPYKLCDFKPVYGYIFEDYLTDFRFWGHCDVDLIIGNLNSFLKEDILSSYDKIFALGHMTLYKNTFSNNRVFMSCGDDYKKFLTSFDSWAFDEDYVEGNINMIYRRQHLPFFTEDFSFNPKVLPTRFVRTKYVGGGDYRLKSPPFKTIPNQFQDEIFVDALYVFDKGNISRYYKEGNKLVQESFLYFHLQHRDMKVCFDDLKIGRFMIVPNQFRKLDFQINFDTFDSITRNPVCFHYLKKMYQYKIKKVKSFICNLFRLNK